MLIFFIILMIPIIQLIHWLWKRYPSETVTGVLCIVIIGFAIRMYSDWKKSNLEQKRFLEARKVQQHSLYTQLVSNSTTSLNHFEIMPDLLHSSEEWLDQAEQDFKEGVFAPFWDSIEKATEQLGHFDLSVQAIIRSSNNYTKLATKYEDHLPRFPIDLESVRAMTNAKTTSERLRSIVRKAQSNPHFAMIYEQRRTNQILVAGFNSLGQALDSMGQQISSSINSIENQISQMSSTLESSLSMVHEHFQSANHKLIESVDNLHSTAKKEASDQAERHSRALNMLDNIQRHRKPGMFDR